MLAPKGFGARARRERASSRPTARLQRQEYRLRLKRLPPIRWCGWFPPFKSSTPDGFRGSCAYAYCAPWSNGNLRFRFGNKNCLSLTFSLQNGIQEIPGGEEGSKGE
jgi:hypothetical protein